MGRAVDLTSQRHQEEPTVGDCPPRGTWAHLAIWAGSPGCNPPSKCPCLWGAAAEGSRISGTPRHRELLRCS